MSLPRYQNFVHGKYLANSTGETFDVINPATGEVAYQMEKACDDVRQAAMESAQEGFAVWKKMSGMERSRILLKAVA